MEKRKYGSIIKATLFSLVLFLSLGFHSLPVEAATNAAKEAFKAELVQMLENVDSTPHDLSQYKISPNEFIEISESLKKGDTRLLWYSYYSSMYLKYDMKFSRINNVSIINADDKVMKRYPVLKNNVENIQAGLRSDMTDLDKIIYLHNCLVEITSYSYIGYQSYGACGALGENMAVCSGYTKALNMLLDMVGIEAKYISSPTLNHGWTLVKLDGEWYHIDATWDDTRSAVKGQVGHQFLLKNDQEFSGWKSHADWTDPGEEYHSTSTRFSDWYVQKITGKMIFDQGYWYYVDNETNNLMKATATGSDMQIVVDGTGREALTLLEVVNGLAIYSCNGQQYDSNDVIIIEPEVPEEESPAQESESTDAKENPDESITPSEEETPNAETDSSESENTNILALNLKDYTLWSMKQYNTDTLDFNSSSTRLSLGKIYSVDSLTEYTVKLSDKDLAFRIYELDQNQEVIVQHSLPDATGFVTSINCEYIALELYCPANEWNYNSKAYKSLFSSTDFSIGLTAVAPAEVKGSYTWDTIDNWRIGRYSVNTGAYAKTPKTRICLHDYIYTKPNSTYNVSINNSKYRLTIVQYDSNYKYISDSEYADSSSFKVADNCTYLGVSLYSPSLEWSLSYSTYTELFANGFVASIIRQADAEEELTETETEPDSLYPNIISVDLKDPSNWKLGQYNATTVLPESSQTRVYLNSYYAALPNTRYIATLSANDMAFCVYELSSDMELIVSHFVPTGGSFVTSDSCRYVAIDLFNYTNEWNWDAKKYKTNFFNQSNLALNLTPEPNPATINMVLWDNISQWRSGCYKDDTGVFAKKKTRICLFDYLYTEANTTFLASINNNSYRFLVVEYDRDYNYIGSTVLKNEEQFTTSDNCKYLGVSIYSPTLEWTLNYASYEALFTNNFEVSLVKILNIDDTDTPAACAVPTNKNYTIFTLIGVLAVFIFGFVAITYRKRR